MTAADYVDVFVRGRAGRAADELMLPAWSEGGPASSSTTVTPFRTSDVVIQRGMEDRVSSSWRARSGQATFDGVSISSLARAPPASSAKQSFFGQPRSANVWAVTEGMLLRWEFDQYTRFR